MLPNCGGSPFEDETFSSSLISTFVNGQRVGDGSKIDDNVRDERLTFARQAMLNACLRKTGYPPQYLPDGRKLDHGVEP
ncbi:hypothetical protein B0E51_08580 [Rhodanobacter sp. C05]|nr:hypothetical protein B0E51_08580 [Rhodanobacter sp. C05]